MEHRRTPVGQAALWELNSLRALVVVCCVIELALQLSDFGLIGVPRLRGYAYEYGAFWPGLLGDWRPNYRFQSELMFVTYGFLHAGLAHLLFNMITLWSLGVAVLERAGMSGFFAIYLGSLIAGGAMYGVFADAGVPMIGASGALFGLAGALVAWAWISRANTMASIRGTWRVLVFLILMNVVMYVVFNGRLAWQTHLGGFIAGWAIGLVLVRRRR